MGSGIGSEAEPYSVNLISRGARPALSTPRRSLPSVLNRRPENVPVTEISLFAWADAARMSRQPSVARTMPGKRLVIAFAVRHAVPPSWRGLRAA